MAWWQRYEAQSATREAQNALTGSFFRTIGVSSADIPTQDEREALWELAQLDPANAVVRENLLNRWFSTAESFMRGEARNGQGFRAAIGLNLKYRRITTRNAGEFGLRLASLLEKPREIQFSLETLGEANAIGSLFAVDRRWRSTQREGLFYVVGHRAVLPATSARSAPRLHRTNLYHRACRYRC